jgi:hypothetical protein
LRHGRTSELLVKANTSELTKLLSLIHVHFAAEVTTSTLPEETKGSSPFAKAEITTAYVSRRKHVEVISVFLFVGFMDDLRMPTLLLVICRNNITCGDLVDELTECHLRTSFA